MQHQITLSQGRTATVSAQDFRRVLRHKWCLLKRPGRSTDYAQANIKINGEWKRILLHRFILAAGSGQQVDHADGNGLNCTRDNMRLATHAGNMRNTRSHRDSLSRFKGVSWSKVMKRWHAQITKDRKYYDVGYFSNEEDAARAYDDKAKELHGEFARLNFPA